MSYREEVTSRGGLVVYAAPDDWWENPLGWTGVREMGRERMGGVEGEQVSDPGLIDCPDCRHPDGSPIGSDYGLILGVRKGPGGPETFDRECPGCKGETERLAKTMEEWCEAEGKAAALPVSYNFECSQPWIHAVDWDDLEDACSILYLDRGESPRQVEEIEAALENLDEAVRFGFSVLTVEVDPDGDLPEDVLEGADCPALGGCLGGLGEVAAEMLEEALEEVKRELTEREEWARRGVVTV